MPSIIKNIFRNYRFILPAIAAVLTVIFVATYFNHHSGTTIVPGVAGSVPDPNAVDHCEVLGKTLLCRFPDGIPPQEHILGEITLTLKDGSKRTFMNGCSGPHTRIYTNCTAPYVYEESVDSNSFCYFSFKWPTAIYGDHHPICEQPL